MPKKRMLAGESQQETANRARAAPPGSRFADNWSDTEGGARTPKGVLTWVGEPVMMTQPDPSKLKGKLDT